MDCIRDNPFLLVILICGVLLPFINSLIDKKSKKHGPSRTGPREGRSPQKEGKQEKKTESVLLPFIDFLIDKKGKKHGPSRTDPREGRSPQKEGKQEKKTESEKPKQQGYDSREDTKTCPFCAEEIKAAAIKCKHCGSMLSGKSK